jgi:hypothetical protein
VSQTSQLPHRPFEYSDHFVSAHGRKMRPISTLETCFPIGTGLFALVVFGMDGTSPPDHSPNQDWPPPPFHCHAPERYHRCIGSESDVSYELIVGQPAFSKSREDLVIAWTVGVENERSGIPDWVLPDVRKLIMDWWAIGEEDRQTFDGILARFKLMVDVKSSKVFAFVEMIKNKEAENSSQ